MKIAWFSPMDKNSGIGRYSLAAAKAIIECGEKVEIFYADNGELLPTELPRTHFSKDSSIKVLLRGFDFVVYNMGNYLPFHEDIYEVSKKLPGVVVLHDIVMHHFIIGYYRHVKKSNEAYIKKAVSLYGQENLFRNSVNGKAPVWESDNVMDFPFFEPFVQNALGVICHSNYAHSFISKYYRGNNKMLYFPYLGLSDYPALPKPKEKRLRVFAVCNNPNKCSHILLEALGKNPKLAKKISVRFVGSVDMPSYKEQLSNLICKYKLQKCVTMVGRVSDEDFITELSLSDIVVNLRNPSLEGASSALMEQMWAGKPTVVYSHGFYGEMPNDCVYKISPSNQINELAEALSILIKSKNLREEMGTRAYEHSRKIFDAQTYAVEFLKFAEEINFSRPIENLLTRVAIELKIMGMSPNNALLKTTAQETENLFGA
jgi:glycosyltransferase involved in cell wall biosynthesis